MSNRGLLEQLERTTETLSHSLSNLIKYSSVAKERDDEDSGEQHELPESTAKNSTSGLMMVNAQTAQLIKGIQDLLVMTRSIREKWLLTQIPDEGVDSQSELDYEKCSQLLKQWTQEVVGSEE
ncbi:Mediator of RNA polymerase II transcription subunit 22 [Lachancea thermotolerans]